MPVQKQGSIIGCKCTSTLRREEIMNYIGKYLGDLGGLTNKYSSILMTVGIVFALLNCFFGYKLRKVWITLVGALAGACSRRRCGVLLFKGCEAVSCHCCRRSDSFGGICVPNLSSGTLCSVRGADLLDAWTAFLSRYLYG